VIKAIDSHQFINIHNAIDIIGLIGLILFLLAVYRLSIKKWSGKPLWYELDVIGSVVCLGIYSYSKGAYLGIITTLIWGILTIRGLISFRERRNIKKKKKNNKI